ncbi:DNA-directed RNA polymerase subunit alpha [Gossypium arboreum]|uniref:DNA-directed RNA polymerase subunit alpha n=1 Tax=Gossypium arboreum TaxID=29729 RepID=A0A0B0MI58_GOSAR|nr:DNA-directed RNA polymerase subunit alpha [Gossypium arboreum]
MCDYFRPWSSLLNRHGRVVHPREEVQAVLILYVGPFSPFFGSFLVPFTLLCSPKYKI